MTYNTRSEHAVGLPPDVQSCGTCKFFWDHVEPFNDHTQHFRVLTCRRFPPPGGGWGLDVKIDGWCGEWAWSGGYAP